MSSNCQAVSLLHIAIRNFRNLVAADLNLSSGHNLFIGDNGHGKTNCLEAIALACSLKSMHGFQNADLINKDSENAHIKSHFSSHHLSVDILPLGKRAKLNDQNIKNTARLAELSPLISFIPAELNMVVQGKNLRRRALDQATVGLFFEHMASLRAYEKILSNRNHLLKSWPIDHDALKIFTDMLIAEGAKIIALRTRTLELIKPHFNAFLAQILGQFSDGDIEYTLNKHVIHRYTELDSKALLYEEFRNVESLEKIRKITLFGPHLDDIQFMLNNLDAKTKASRGQTRAIVIAFKLAQMQAIYEIRSATPLIILDDIVSELDEAKKQNLVSALTLLKAQIFFSATDQQSFGRNIPIEQVFKVDQGAITAKNP